MVLGFCVFHYLLPILPSSLPSCHSTFFPSPLPLCPLPPSFFPSLLSVLSPSALPSSLPPFFPSSFSPSFFPSSLSPSSFPPPFLLVVVLLPSLPSSLPPFLPLFYSPPPLFSPSLLPSFLPLFLFWCFISRKIFQFLPTQFFICPLYQVVVFQLIERSLLLAHHRLSACELGFSSVEFYFTHSSSCRCHFFFTQKQLLVVFSPILGSKRKKSPQYSVLFYPKFETLKLVKEKS